MYCGYVCLVFQFIHVCLTLGQQQAVDPLEQALNKAKENEQSQLIRMGKLTPFEAHGLRKQPTSLGINKNGQPAKIGVGSVRPVISHST